ncbi:uncharacterized protein PITG_22204 [Phytophthora infestans T30-4]|uniref:Uncharacterized protein n=1 Tax=Phytophthora infestans (strain T30-4) TaxID=403677 RepID=D0RLZ8_PHYIT|nr:uncharacterized protein PITG_22204 [Phytophthora infestans T30-4]EEY55906.1 conserved hypothetical protein [Phytophthora infestans T30-4]|eukprot:XP_002909932.1 conserved hypothetical protein [Phytophthora infestans T30-4]
MPTVNRKRPSPGHGERYEQVQGGHDQGTASGESKCGAGVSFDLVSAENKVSVDAGHNRAGTAETYGEIVTQNTASVKCGRRLYWHCGQVHRGRGHSAI